MLVSICQVVQLLKKKDVDFQEVLRLIREGQNVNAKDKVQYLLFYWLGFTPERITLGCLIQGVLINGGGRGWEL